MKLNKYGKFSITTSSVVATLLFTGSVFRCTIQPGLERFFFWVLVELTVSLSLAAWMWKNVNKYVAAFLVLATFSHIYPQYGGLSREAFRTVFFMIVWYCLVVKFIDEKPLLRSIVAIVVVNYVFLVLQYYDMDPFQPDGLDVMTGMLANQNEVSALFAISFFAFWRVLPQRLRWLVFPFVGAGLYLSHSMGGTASVVAAAGFYFSVQKRQEQWARPLVILFFVSLLLALALNDYVYNYFATDSGVTVRLQIWKQWWGLYEKQWVFGYGLGHWSSFFTYHAHNDILQAGFVMGAGFFVLFLLYAGSIVRASWKSNALALYAAQLVGIAVSASSFFVFDIGPTAIIAVTWMAITEKQLRACPVLLRR